MTANRPMLIGVGIAIAFLGIAIVGVDAQQRQAAESRLLREELRRSAAGEPDPARNFDTIRERLYSSRTFGYDKYTGRMRGILNGTLRDDDRVKFYDLTWTGVVVGVVGIGLAAWGFSIVTPSDRLGGAAVR